MSDPSSEATIYHQTLIDKLVGDKLIQSPPVEAAFRAVPRHLFLPDLPVAEAYEDRAIPTKLENGRAISSSSQPAIMAIMLEQLAIQPGHNVLEIGAGTGYNAALMANLVGENGQVTTMDIDEDIVLAAKAHLAEAAVPAPVHVICADGTLGWAAHAPYDRIILTVGGWDISPAWLEQLKPDGRILLPLSLNGPQLAVAFDRSNAHLVSQSVAPCGFMRLRGPFAEPEYQLALGPSPNLTLQATAPLPDTADTFYEWLQQSPREHSTQVKITFGELWRDLSAWLSLHEKQFCQLVDVSGNSEESLVPLLFQSETTMPWCSSIGLWSPTGLALLTRRPTENKTRMKLAICSFGPEDTAAHQLQQRVQEWANNGRPNFKDLSIIAYPRQQPYQPGPQEIVLPKQWQKFILRWQ